MSTAFNSSFEAISHDDLRAAVGGDGWGDYTSKLGHDWKDVTNRWNEAKKYSYHNGNDPGKFAYNYAGALFNGGKLANDATGGILWDTVKGAVGKKK
jgi:hypothetical protein